MKELENSWGNKTLSDWVSCCIFGCTQTVEWWMDRWMEGAVFSDGNFWNKILYESTRKSLTWKILELLVLFEGTMKASFQTTSILCSFPLILIAKWVSALLVQSGINNNMLCLYNTRMSCPINSFQSTSIQALFLFSLEVCHPQTAACILYMCVGSL